MSGWAERTVSPSSSSRSLSTPCVDGCCGPMLSVMRRGRASISGSGGASAVLSGSLMRWARLPGNPSAAETLPSPRASGFCSDRDGFGSGCRTCRALPARASSPNARRRWPNRSRDSALPDSISAARARCGRSSAGDRPPQSAARTDSGPRPSPCSIAQTADRVSESGRFRSAVRERSPRSTRRVVRSWIGQTAPALRRASSAPPGRATAQGRIFSRPIQRAFLPHIEKAGQHQGNENQHLDESRHLVLAVHHHPGIQKYGFDIEYDEEHADQVKFHAKALSRAACGSDAALIGQVLHAVPNLLAEQKRDQQQGPSDRHGDQSLQQDREIDCFVRGHLLIRGRETKSCLTLTIIVYEMGCQPMGGIGSRQIVVNGVARQAPSGQTLLDLLRELQLEPSRVAVEMDRRIVKRSEWETLELPVGAKIEIVQFVGGG